MMNTDPVLYRQGISAVAQLKTYYPRGAYRIIRDPEGVISFWAIEGTEKSPFSVSFADQGRFSTGIEQMSPAFVKSFLAYVNSIIRR